MNTTKFTLFAILMLTLLLFSQPQPTVGIALQITPTTANYLPVIYKQPLPTPSPTPQPNDWLSLVNHYRALAGVPPVNQDATLNDNCFQHARYMAENNHLTHNQDPSLPFASATGQICAQKGNAWLGSAFSQPIWTVADTIDGWMSSVGHRLWLLYPTTPTFGYGFYMASNNRAGAALDVLSRATFNDDQFHGWPVRYPAPGQTAVPATRYPITLNWRYFGSSPALSSTSLVAQGSTTIAHTADTNLPVGHEGVQIIPNSALPANTTLTVTIKGRYDNNDFSYSWSFATGN
ncbi:MAG: CAP domain-containing protein [Anaerolineales bacterium]|nr:CAP domain-containing protein [Anaerolineales bacterium]